MSAAVIFAAPTGAEAPQPDKKTPQAHWASNGCDHGFHAKSAKRGIRTALRPIRPRYKRARYFARCTRTIQTEKAMRSKIKDWSKWRRSYDGYWTLEFERLPAEGRAWAKNTAECESGGEVDPQHAYNPAGPWYSYLQWSLSTWYSAGGNRHPYDASFKHQASLAWPWHLSHPTNQWPECGE